MQNAPPIRTRNRPSLIGNFAIVIGLTRVLRLVNVPAGEDATSPAD